METFIHPTAIVEDGATIGDGCMIWAFAHVRTGARLGPECIVGERAFIDAGVQVGMRCKIQNNVSVYHGVTVEDGVFIGPHVVLTNDKQPRAVNPDMSLKSNDDWEVSPILVRKGAAIGANSTIVCGITLGEFCVVGAGSVVTRDVPDRMIVAGNPARVIREADF